MEPKSNPAADRSMTTTPAPPTGVGEQAATMRVPAMPYTLVPHIDTYLSHRRRTGEIGPLTASDARSVLYTFAQAHRHRPVDKLGPRTVDRWLATIGHLRPATRRRYVSVVRVFCRWLTSRGVIPRDPTTHVARIPQPRHVDRTLDPADFVALLAHAPDQRAKAMLWVMYGCGARCIEITRLRVEDYHRRDRTLLLTGKGGHERTVPVPEPVAHQLDTYLAEGATAGPLFRSHTNPAAGISPKFLSDLVAGWMAAAGIKRGARDGVSAHALRHTFAHDVLDVTDDIRVVQELLGHANVSTTSRYVGRARRAEMRRAVEDRFRVA